MNAHNPRSPPDSGLRPGPASRARRLIPGRTAPRQAHGPGEYVLDTGTNGWRAAPHGAPLSSGDFAWILAWGLGGRPFYEGRALLLARVPEKDNLWLVQFPSGRPCERYVFAEFQVPAVAEPILLAFWRASVGPEIATEFERPSS